MARTQSRVTASTSASWQRSRHDSQEPVDLALRPLAVQRHGARIQREAGPVQQDVQPVRQQHREVRRSSRYWSRPRLGSAAPSTRNGVRRAVLTATGGGSRVWRWGIHRRSWRSADTFAASANPAGTAIGVKGLGILMGAVGRQAVVLGASVGGLLAARVLADSFASVTVIERDVLPDGAATRRGAPQARHPHALLTKGGHILDQLFPGLLGELVDRGAPLWDDGDWSKLYMSIAGHVIAAPGSGGFRPQTNGALFSQPAVAGSHHPTPGRSIRQRSHPR